ncbi:tRNA lysidine(34) synthetase TilS [Candidatus Magnetobacterium casense]|uniref:tRNA(Ile)-lysidine synthase n=1 Tax=Candidatus Magnetobacterium casense TaxID=1455061 RepID=A0ABS6S2G4_9BACT|nr:tRNA lysidine(34) synthetase TilS [Candidatus Magnetobacterium casensis]MBV6343031.1 tRNA lysidine(34) synthetase TilS [Candidatus Magnetobacterium casensis]
MNIRDKLRATIRAFSMSGGYGSGPVLSGCILVGLSGGPDSVALLRLLRELFPTVSVHAIYIDHGLRPHETPAEKAFCGQLCEHLGVPLSIRAIDALPRKTPATMRQSRYRLYEETALQIGASKIALGHNKDDQAETVMLNLIRGASLTGLAGIAPTRGMVIRPLIDVSRWEILQYLNECNQTYCLDSSNLKDIYLRNRVRIHLMPALVQYNPNIVDTLTRNARIIREEDEYLELAVTKKLMTLISRKTDQKIELFLVPLQGMERVLLRRLLRRATATVEALREIGVQHIEEIIALIKNASTGDRLYLPGAVRVIKGYSTLVITSEPPVRISETELSLPGEVVIREAGYLLRATLPEHFRQPDNNRQACLDAALMSSTLKVRARVNGDYFYPLGLGKRKKVQDYFVDEKVPRDSRNSIPLVLSNDDLVWIAGYRPDDRYKVTPATKSYCLLELIPIRGA